MWYVNTSTYWPKKKASIDAIVKVTDIPNTVPYAALYVLYHSFGTAPGTFIANNCHKSSTINDIRPMLTNCCAFFLPNTSPTISVMRNKKGNMIIETVRPRSPRPIGISLPPKRLEAYNAPTYNPNIK